MTKALAFELEPQYIDETRHQKDFKLTDIPKNITRYAITRNPFFHFDNLKRFFPNIDSLSGFIDSKDYLGGLEITVSGNKTRLENITNDDFLAALNGLLLTIEAEIKANLVEYEGSDYVHDYVHKVFKDKEIRINANDERAKGQEQLVLDKSWYAFNANYGTQEEKGFVELFSRRFDTLSQKFENIYLIRNERELKIFDKLGRAFEPDFILFCKQKNGKNLTYQVFIEPKGEFLKGHDSWKQDFLSEIAKDKKTISIDTDSYLITGVPFYTSKGENDFSRILEETLE